jgi:RNA recognition motif-containing protein
LPAERTEEEVKTMCGEYGPIVSVILPTNYKGVRKGIAYVHFKDGPSALAAVEALDETEQDEGKNLSVARAKTKAERTKERKKLLARAKGGNKTKKTPRTKLYVGNLDPGVDEDKLFEDFEPYGKVTEVQVKNGEKGVYGFVTYSKPGDATKALKGMETYKVEYARRKGTRGPRRRARQPPKEGAED